MKRLTLPFIVAISLLSVKSNAQVGINTSTPASTLDVIAKNATGSASNVDGLLVPRVDRLRAQSMTSVPTSTMIYVNNVVTGTQLGATVNVDTVGYYYFNGTAWVKMKSTDTTDLNIYNSNGSLTGNRIVTQGANTLAFTGTATNAFSVDGSTFSVDAANDRVGIGTATPHSQLQLGSTVTNRKIVMYETGDNDHEFYGFGVNSGIMRYQADRTTTDHVFYAGVTGGASSNELFRIKGTGNVGIGTATPQNKLHINGGLQVTSEINVGGNASTAGSSGSSGQILASNGAGAAPSWKTLNTVSGTISTANYVQGTTALDIPQGTTADVPGATITLTVPAGTTQTFLFTILGYATFIDGNSSQGVFALLQNGVKISSAFASKAGSFPGGAALGSMPIPVTFLKSVNLSAGTYIFKVQYSAWFGTATVNFVPSAYAGYNGDTEAMLTKMQILVYNN